MQIEIVSIVPSLIVLAAAALVAELVARSSGAWRTLLAEGASQKYVTIEGLRGCLALAVFLSHGVALHFWYQTGERLWPPSVFYRLCGSVSVYMFFMVTGLLFWGKAIAGGGHIDIRRLYASRLRRLAPMYLFCLVPIFTIVGYRTGWTLRVPPLELAASIGAWLGLGMLAFPDINGVADTLSIDGALWTLCYEWLFYLALPLLAVFATRSRFVGVAAIGVAAPLLVGQRGYLAASILVGMAIAQFGEGLRAPAWLRSRPVALGAALPLIASLGLSDGVSGLWPFVGAVPLFVAIAAGNDLWGVRAAPCAFSA